MNLRPGVFLDRDGVLNRAVVRDKKPYPPATIQELEILDGVAQACSTLSAAGAVLVMVTNQPDIARGRISAEIVETINRFLCSALGLQAAYVCPHDDADGCTCRKPAPGLILQSVHAYGIDLARSVMVGDRWRDIAAGQLAGCRTVFVDYNYAEQKPAAPDFVCASLQDALSFILSVINADPRPGV